MLFFLMLILLMLILLMLILLMLIVFINVYLISCKAEFYDDSQKKIYLNLTKDIIQREQTTWKRFRFFLSNDTNWYVDF
jgi:hypothetical protein